jgi:hypothetical protein
MGIQRFFYERQDGIEKPCVKCKIIKLSYDYYSNKRNCNGLNSECKECVKNRSNVYFKSDQGQDIRQNYYDDVIKQNVPKYFFKTTMANAKAKGFEHKIDISDLIIPKFCPIFGSELKISDNGYQKASSPSVDRIDNTKGYTKENIVIVSWRANNIKANATIDEMSQILINWDKIITKTDQIYDNKNRINKMFYHATERAKLKKIPFNIEKVDIVIPKICPVLNISLSINNRDRETNSPSLDKINNNNGYVKGNVRVISWKANSLKGDATYDEYCKVFNFYKELVK